MKNIFRNTGFIALVLALAATVFTACENNDFDTDQYYGDVRLNVFGPSPVARGGELRFIGPGMDQIIKIQIPGCDDITEITRVSPTEIRCAVPQTAEPGKVKLIYANGEIETRTMLTFSEPITIESFSPAEIEPGKELTIKGTYLNLINEVCFSFVEDADSVNVFADDFISRSREEIKVVVPEEAVSGIIIVSDAKTIPNTVKSEAQLTVFGPKAKQVLNLTNAKPGNTVKIEGEYFHLIRRVVMPDGYDVDFEATRDAITFKLPETSADGAIIGIAASKEKVSLANIGMVVPTELVATPSTGLRAGDEITVKGINLDEVTTLTFPGTEEPVKPTDQTANSFKVVFPATAQSGDVLLNLRSGKSVTLALSTAKPEVTGFDPVQASAAGQLKLIGRNLDLIASITFKGAEQAVEVKNPAPAEVVVTVPAVAETGALTLTMANGETVTTSELTVLSPECAFITSVETAELTAGEIMVANISNGDKLTGVEVNGQSVQYILNGSRLFISLPSSCGKNTKVTLKSSNGEISYTYDVIPATHVEKVIFNEMFNLGNWDGGGLRIYKNDLEGVPAGAKMVFYYAASEDGQIQINDANWGQIGDIFDVPASGSKYEVTLTAEMLSRGLSTSDGWSETAFVINGKALVISKIALEYEQSLETTIWEGSWTNQGWGGNQDLAWGGYDWSSVKAGSILRIYATPVAEGEWWCISLRHGDGWNALPAPIAAQYDTPGSCLEIALPQNVLDDLAANGGLVITGDGYTMTKVTIE